jgi:hypothetical protein
MKKPSKIGKVRVILLKNKLKTNGFLLKSEIKQKNLKSVRLVK